MVENNLFDFTRVEKTEDYDDTVRVVYELKVKRTGAEFICTTTNPYGFVKFKRKSPGRLPDLLSHDFTDSRSAARAFVAFCEQEDEKVVEEIKPVSPQRGNKGA